MSRYIDSDALIEELQRCSRETWSKDINRAWWAQSVKIKDNIVRCIDRQPTADVVEVMHGKWGIMKMGDGERVRTCSSCLISQSVNVYKGKVMFRYCPYCGAKMDGERKDTE